MTDKATVSPEKASAFERQLEISGKSGDRTRLILYTLGLVFAAFAIVSFDFNNFGWSDKRLTIMSAGYFCSLASSSYEDKPPEFIGGKYKCGAYYDYIREYYKLPTDTKLCTKWTPPGTSLEPPNPSPAVTGKPAATEAQDRCIQAVWRALKDRFDQLSKEKVEDRAVTIPIVGSKIDQGSILMFSSIILSMLFFVLKLSLRNERLCLKAIQSLIQTEHEKENVLLGHLFSAPRPILKGRNPFFNASQRPNFWWFLLVPPAFAVYGVWSDFQDGIEPFVFLLHDKVGNTDFRTFAIGEIASAALLCYCSIQSIRSAVSLDGKLDQVRELSL